MNGEDVRVSKRLYIPTKRLRGFESGRIGPVDGGDFIGGNHTAVINASTTLPARQKSQTKRLRKVPLAESGL